MDNLQPIDDGGECCLLFALVGLLFLFGWVGGRIGERRGRWLAGVFLGAILGPLGWAIVWLLPVRRSQ